MLIIVLLAKKAYADYSVLADKIETNSKSPRFKIDDSVRLTKYENIFSKGYTENWSREILVPDSMLKINPWTYRIVNSNGKSKRLFL